MDGTVIFQGPNNDKSAMLFNTTLRHPNNPENFSNFIIATHIDAQIAASSNRGGAIPDDDNDRVTNENDIEAKDKNSDSDGAGITDNIETGGAGKYDYLIDTDPLNPCSPIISSLCVGIDADGDGFFRNYPTTHAQYDAADENPCLPDFNKPNCSCTDNFIDNDNEVLVKICHQQANGRFETIQVPLSTLTLHLEHGDICGPCNN